MDTILYSPSQNIRSIFDESKFILYKFSLSEAKKVQPISNSKDFIFQKCYLVHKSEFESTMLYYKNSLEQNLKAPTYVRNQVNPQYIITKPKDVSCLNDFYVVNENYFNICQRGKSVYDKQNIFLYKNQNNVYLFFPDEKTGNNILEIINTTQLKNIDNNGNNYHYKIMGKNMQVNIFKKCLLLEAFQNDLYKFMKKPIEDEYNDIKEYYLINIHWLEQYKEIYKNLFNNIKFILEKYNKNHKYIYHYFYYNFEELIQHEEIQNIINQINNYNLNIDIFKEDNLLPFYNKDDNYKLYYPREFILVPEYLFDLIFEGFDKKAKTKEEFKVTALIGDNTLFIQDKNDKKRIYTYIVNDMNKYLINYCIFIFNKATYFFDCVKEFIKGKGMINLLLNLKVNINNIGSIQNSYNKNNQLIFSCIIKEKCPKKFMEILETNKEVKLIKSLFGMYKKFIDKIKNLRDQNININNINDIEKNNYLERIPIIIISKHYTNLLLKRIFFEDINIIRTNNDANEKIDNLLFNKLSGQPHIDLKTALNKIDMLDEAKLDYNLKNKKDEIFSFINQELIRLISDNKNDLSNMTFQLFKNKKEYFAYHGKSKKAIRLNFLNEQLFKIEEIELYGDYKNIIIQLINLVKNEKSYKDKIRNSLKYISEDNKIYLINKDWMNTFKEFYKYNTILQYYSYGEDTLLKYIKINENFPEQLKSQNYLNHQFSSSNAQITFPTNFSIVPRDIFDYILKELNTKYNIFLKIDKIYKAFFGDNKIFIQDLMNDKTYFIYSLNNSNYDFDYAIQLQSAEKFQNLFSQCNYTETLEQFLFSNFRLNFIDTKPQIMLDEYLKKKGVFISIKPRMNVKIKEPEHCLGLENIGATCYMNATIQCLCNVFNLRKYFLNRQLVYQETNNRNCQLTSEFYKLINRLWKDSYHGKSYYAPRSFKETISKMNPLFQGIAANDSKDLIIFLYETMHEELNKPDYQNNKWENIYNNNELRSFRSGYYSKNSSIFMKTFYFEQQSELRCLNCKYCKLSYNIFNIIIFPLEKVREFMIKKNPNGFEQVKLEDCFEHFQEKEILSGTNQIYCNQCSQMSNASNGNQLFTLPEVMTIILNRGKGIEFDVNFVYPLRLNVDRFVLDKECKNNDYELIAVLSHIGPSGMAGHFIAICKSPNNRWYIYNDALVNECEDPRNINNDMIEGLPYVLFYQRCNKNNNDFVNIINDDVDMKDYSVDSNKITLYFKFNDKEYYCDIERDKTIYELIIALRNKYDIPLNSSLYAYINDVLIELEQYKKIKDYPDIKNNSTLVVLIN